MTVEEKTKAPKATVETVKVVPGATVRIHQRIQEGEKTRTQVFEGLVIARKHGSENGATVTVRKVTSGVGVEKIFPLALPSIEKIDVVKQAKVRRAKLNYTRSPKARKLKERAA